MYLFNQLQTGLIFFLLFGLTSITTLSEDADDPVFAENIIWHDLVTPDIYQSKAFYEAVFGWELRVIEGNGLRMGTFYSGGKPVAGVLEVPKANTAVWVKAIVISQMDERVAQAKRQGGKVLLPQAEIMGRGVQTVLESSSGEEFSFIVIKGESEMSAIEAEGENRWLWSELWSDNPEESGVFYKGVFGVTIDDKSNGGRPYWVFMSGGKPLAGMIQNPITNQGTQWVPYVQSSDPTGTVEKAEDAGAFVVLQPSPEVRNGKVGVFQDPQGALLCVQNKN
ncbi:VOC family protein [Robertkochia marina]|uniref:VOC family protein n=1 Tax=Robertkochia marina TaxID=1227945 RepID=A0A4S3M027_9FLAO|nr:VOC family protein [Robertkochia marina]THD66347.1 VOC family protein [Robertkochia marina]TRZ44029.1 VOC family protein [Robertkochia marina]